MRRITGILLAAGESRRFGSHKLIAPLVAGVPVVLQSVRNLRAALDDVVVVVRPGDIDLARLLHGEAVTIVPCPDAGQGMGTSLACGIAAARGSDSWLVALADMPWIRAETIQKVVVALRDGHDLVAPACNGRRGHPVGFGNRYRDELLGLKGEAGARNLLTRAAGQCLLIDTDDAGVLRDIDRPPDLQQPFTS